MPMDAVGLAGVLRLERVASKDVLPRRTRTQVQWIHACPMRTSITARTHVRVVTQVVELESFGDRTEPPLIQPAVRPNDLSYRHRTTAEAERAIAPVDRSGPQQTAGPVVSSLAEIHPREEPLLRRRPRPAKGSAVETAVLREPVAVGWTQSALTERCRSGAAGSSTQALAHGRTASRAPRSA